MRIALKRDAAVLLAACAAFTLAGCSDSSGQPIPGPTTVSTQTPTATESPRQTATTQDSPTPTGPVAPSPMVTSRAPQPVGSVTPVLTYAGIGRTNNTYEFSGFVPQIIRAGGTCTFHLRLAGAAVDRDVSAVADATSTSCGTVVIQARDLTKGDWTVTLEYQDSTDSGTSSAKVVAVA